LHVFVYILTASSFLVYVFYCLMLLSLKVLSGDSVESLCTLGRLVSPGDDLSDIK